MANFSLLTQTILASLLISLCSLCSLLAFWIPAASLRRLISMLVALAAGVLLGDAFIHLIPDAAEQQGDVSQVCFTVLLGIFGFFILEKSVRWHHDHNVVAEQGKSVLHKIQPMVRINLISDGLHNFVDGILIAGSFIADPILGITTTAAILAHEIPQELGDVGILIRGGCTPKQAVIYNFICALSVVPGAIFTVYLHQAAENSLNILLPIAAGGFIYIATSDLIPLLHQQSKFRHLAGHSLFFALGIICMQMMILLERYLHIHLGA